MVTTRLTGRALLRSTAAAAALAGAPFVRGAYAAGKLGVATWTIGCPALMTCSRNWPRNGPRKEKVELTIDFVTSQGDKLMLMGAAEAEAHSGHEVIRQPGWYGAAKAECGSRPMT